LVSRGTNALRKRLVPCSGKETDEKMHRAMAEEHPKSKLQEEIDQNLRRVYNDALSQDIPDRFKQLLEELRNREAKK
jgi:hypothetical protein